MKFKKLSIKYENIYLILALVTSIYQLIYHFNKVTITNLILETILILSIDFSIYYSFKTIRLENKKSHKNY